MQTALTEEMKINHFHARLRGLALKTFKINQRTPTTTLEDILVDIHPNSSSINQPHVEK